MDSDDSNISDHVGDLDIQSYQFEPLCNDESQQEREHSTSEDSDIDESSQDQDRPQGLVTIFFFFSSTLKTTREESKMSNFHTTLFQNSFVSFAIILVLN